MICLKNCGIINRIYDLGEKWYILFTLNRSRRKYAPMKLVCNPPFKPKEEEVGVSLFYGIRSNFVGP